MSGVETALPDLSSGNRSFITTSSDHGGIALVICTLLATYVALCYIVRIYMRMTVSGPLGPDDAVCSLATALGLIEMIVFTCAIKFGFGKKLELLSDSEIEKTSKAIYSAQLLYIVTNALTKCTVALLLARIVCIKIRVHACYALLVMSGIWGFASLMAQAIRCGDHAPWRLVGSDTCSDMIVSWKVITAFNVIIEALLFLMPVWVVWGLHTSLSRKLTVVTVFALRLPVIAVAILRLHYLESSLGSREPFLQGVMALICLNVELHYGLMAATIPTLKPFVDAFNTGWGTYDTTGASGYGQRSNVSYALDSLNRKPAISRPFPMETQSTQPSTTNNNHNVATIAFGENFSTIEPTRTRSSSRGSDCSQQMFIQQKRTYEVHYEPGLVAGRTR